MVYLDNSATTAVCRQAIEHMTQAMTMHFGNPSSLHTLGIDAERRVAHAREAVASLIGAKAEQVFFFGSGTEANNTAVLGAAEARVRMPHTAVTTAIEHPSVAACFDRLEEQGWTVIRIRPTADGVITPEMVEQACTSDTTLVSVMMVNNETGAQMDIPTIASRVRRVAPRALIHTDAVQAAGKLAIRAEKWGVDLLTVSGHKIHGPKGVGALYVRKGVRVAPRVLGGGQEKGLRSGTEAVPAIVGFGAAAAAVTPYDEQDRHYRMLKDELIRGISDIEDVRFHLPSNGVPYIVNVSFMGFRSETMLNFLAQHDVFVSSGSACAKGQHSAVLAAMGLSEAEIDGALRISFCRDTTAEDIHVLCDVLHEAIQRLQRRKIG